MALLLKTAELQHAIEELKHQFGPQSDSPDFFDNDLLVLDFSQAGQASSEQQVVELVQTLDNCRLKPVAYRGAGTDCARVLKTLGLMEAATEPTRSKTTVKSKPIAPVIQQVPKEVIREVPAPAALVIDKPLRSGQKVYARGTDLVVLSMVNQGAEIVADGNIHVYAALRGKAMAGASGNTSARIFSICLDPELISIAGVYRTSENPFAAHVKGKAAQVYLSNDGQEKLIFEALIP